MVWTSLSSVIGYLLLNVGQHILCQISSASEDEDFGALVWWARSKSQNGNSASLLQLFWRTLPGNYALVTGPSGGTCKLVLLSRDCQGAVQRRLETQTVAS